MLELHAEKPPAREEPQGDGWQVSLVPDPCETQQQGRARALRISEIMYKNGAAL